MKFCRELIFLLVCLILISIANAACGDCNNGTCVTVGENDYCSCFSGFTGAACDIKASDTCPWGNLKALEVEYYPTLQTEKSTFNNHTLTLVIHSPLVNGREETTITIQNSTSPSCKYPGLYWTKNINNCSDEYVGTIPWRNAVNCGWNVMNTTDWLIYSAYVNVKFKDMIDNFRGVPIYRHTTYSFPIQIRFKRNIALSHNIVVYSSIEGKMALTKQEIYPQESKAILEITTSVQWPFRYANPLVSVPSGFIPTLTDITNYEVSCMVGKPCTQIWELQLDIEAGICTLTGNYVFQWNQTCHSDFKSDCPLDYNSNTIDNATVTIISEDFCTKVIIDIDLSGTIATYKDAEFKERKDSFLFNQIAYFKCDLTTNGKAKLQAVSVTDVWVVENGTEATNFLYNEKGVTNSNYAITMYDLGTSSTGFSFLVSPETTPVPLDQSRIFTIYSKIEVFYAEIVQPNSQPVIRRREITFEQKFGSTGTQETTTTKELLIRYMDPPLTQQLNSSRSAIGIIGYLIIIILFGVVFFGHQGLMCYRRFSKAKEKLRLYIFLHVVVVFSVFRLVGEAIRLVYSTVNDSMLNRTLQIFTSIVSIGLYIILTLFIDLWLEVCREFIKTPKVIPVIRILCILVNIVQVIIQLVNVVLVVVIEDSNAQYIFTLVLFVSIGLTLVLMTGIILYLCFKIVFMLRESIKLQKNQTIQVKRKNQMMLKVSIGVAGIFISYFLYLVYITLVVAKVNEHVGSWILIASNIHEWVLLGVFGIILFPHQNISKLFNKFKKKKEPSPSLYFTPRTERPKRKTNNEVMLTDEELAQIEEILNQKPETNTTDGLTDSSNQEIEVTIPPQEDVDGKVKVIESVLELETEPNGDVSEENSNQKEDAEARCNEEEEMKKVQRETKDNYDNNSMKSTH